MSTNTHRANFAGGWERRTEYWMSLIPLPHICRVTAEHGSTTGDMGSGVSATPAATAAIMGRHGEKRTLAYETRGWSHFMASLDSNCPPTSAALEHCLKRNELGLVCSVQVSAPCLPEVLTIWNMHWKFTMPLDLMMMACQHAKMSTTCCPHEVMKK